MTMSVKNTYYKYYNVTERLDSDNNWTEIVMYHPTRDDAS